MTSPAGYPQLGFDPLPGDPIVAERLAADARRLGHELEDAATRLRGLVSPNGWHGEAAEAFTASIHALPRDLAVSAEAWHGLARELDRFTELYTQARGRARRLDDRAGAARSSLRAAQQAEMARGEAGTTWALAAGDTDRARRELAEILAEAARLRAEFEESLRPVAAAIRRLAEPAPAEPAWEQLARLATAVLPITPFGAIVTGVHRLVNAFPEFFDDLADLAGTISTVLGIAAALTFWLPGLGQSLAVLSLATSAGATLLKTSLYLAESRDANGRRYVDGGELVASWASTAVATVAPALGAAAALRSGSPIGSAVARQVTLAGPRQIRYETGAVAALVRDRGLAGALAQIGRTETMSWRAMDATQRAAYLASRGGDGLGLQSAFGVTRLPGQLVRVVTTEPDTPDLTVGRRPSIRPPR